MIAKIPNITKEIKQQCTVEGEDGKPCLAEEFYGLVVEVNGQSISSRNRRLTHPRMVRFRADKTKEECIYTSAFLKTQMV